jgi:hypothetical protein
VPTASRWFDLRTKCNVLKAWEHFRSRWQSQRLKKGVPEMGVTKVSPCFLSLVIEFSSLPLGVQRSSTSAVVLVVLIRWFCFGVFR